MNSTPANRGDYPALSESDLRRICEALQTPAADSPLGHVGASDTPGVRLIAAVRRELRQLHGSDAAAQNARRLLLDLPLARWRPDLQADVRRIDALGHAIALVAQRSDFLTEAVALDASCAQLLFEACLPGCGSLAAPMDRRELAELLEKESFTPDGQPAPEGEFHKAAASANRWHLVRIGLRDVLHLADMPDMMREISDLSEITLRAATHYFLRGLEERHGQPIQEATEAGIAAGSPAAFCVVSMGKGGGRELNFSSDVDLVFVYSGEGQTQGAPNPTPGGRPVRQISNHDLFNRLSEQIIAFLSRPWAGGPIYRVDMRLRPEGNHGPLARSLGSFRHYFADQALSWERVAYAKARAIAGPRPFREMVERSFREFVFADIFNTEMLAEIKKLKARIDHEVARQGHKGLDIKRGPGGIREIEFLLVALQLLYANDVPGLRQRRSTLGVLDGLLQAGILDGETGETLRRDYLFLRQLEQRLQLVANRQTHLLPLPADPEERERLFRRFWETAAAELMARMAEVRRHVETEFRRLFQEERAPVPEALPLLHEVLDPDADEASLRQQLAVYRLRDASSIQVLRRLSDGTREIYTTRREKRFFEAIFASLMNVAARIPHPDAALRHFEDFVRQTRSSGGTFELLAEYPRTLEVVLRAAGHGDYLASLLARNPEFIDELFSPDTLGSEPPTLNHFDRLMRSMKRAKSLDQRMRIVRRHRNLETLRIGVRHVLGLDTWPVTARMLSALARQSVAAALHHCTDDPELYPRCVEAGFALIALGKIALDELTWFSDLDVLFITHDAEEECTRLALALIEFLGKPTSDGSAYELDARLRPLGRTAPLVTRGETLVDYFAQSAETWEFLAFTRACHLEGNTESSATILGRIGHTYERMARRLGLPAQGGVASEIIAMRQRMEASVGKLPEGVLMNYKRGRGGIVDLEFTRQAITLAGLARQQLQLDGTQPAVLTCEALMRAVLQGRYAAWSRNYSEFRRIEASNRLLRGDGRDVLSSEPVRLESLAYALGRTAEVDLLAQEIQEMADENRQIFQHAMEVLPSLGCS